MSWHLSMEGLFIVAAQYEDGMASSLDSSSKELAVPNPNPEWPQCNIW